MKALPLLLLAMSMPMFAQTITCNSATHYDSKGNVCTNFTTAPYSYSPYRTPVRFDMDTQDGKAVNPDNPHSVVLGYVGQYPFDTQIGIPDDPLITLGFIPSYGTSDSIVYANSPETVVIPPPVAGQSSYTALYTFTGGVNTVQKNLGTGGGYLWYGSLQLTYTLAYKSCRYGRCSYYYNTGPGVGELSAVQ
jgi:hypothetical protein